MMVRCTSLSIFIMFSRATSLRKENSQTCLKIFKQSIEPGWYCYFDASYESSFDFTLIGCLSGAGLVVIGLWLLNLAIFHTWNSDRFLSGSQEVSDWHQKWALVLFVVSLFAFIAAGAIIWGVLVRRKVQSKIAE